MTDTFLGFWKDLPRPVIALAPMDGITDMPCRNIIARHGGPDVTFTEFMTTEGLFHAPVRLLRTFEYTEVERPVIAQIYGPRPEDFYRATHIVCELGFDGVDINMGCPARKVVRRNCGAGLIREPQLALEIIQATRQAILDWTNGQNLEDIDVSQKLIDTVREMNERGMRARGERKRIPYSVKTRLGYDRVIVEEWVERLLQERPAVISIHGRTLKQMYKGSADWDAIARAARVIHQTETLVIGNGDISSAEQAVQRILESGVDGVMLGRCTLGNPWIFRSKEAIREHVKNRSVHQMIPPSVTREERLCIASEHARLLHAFKGERAYHAIKRHLKGYLSQFPEAGLLRKRAMRTKNLSELETLLNVGRKLSAGRQSELQEGLLRFSEASTDLPGDVHEENRV